MWIIEEITKQKQKIMQSTRLLFTTQRCLSAWKRNYLLKRCLRISNSININIKNSNLNRIDYNSSSLINGRLLFLSNYNITSIRYASSKDLPTHKKLTLPALSPTMETGTLRSWSKQEGEKIAEGNKYNYYK